jgi:hypothetical protein
MQGHTFANERMKRFIELGGFHRLSLMEMGDDWVLSRREILSRFTSFFFSL